MPSDRPITTPSPVLATALIGVPSLAGVPFFLAGGVKIVHDLLLYQTFAAVRPPEEGGCAGVA